jgi:hypothetical protein
MAGTLTGAFIVIRVVFWRSRHHDSGFCATYRPAWDMLSGEAYLTNDQRKTRW